MYHIVFLAPYSSSIPLIEQVFLARPDCDELFYEIILDRYNNQLEHIHADAVIARGFTARTMKRLNIPGVELSVSGYDVVQAIDRAVKGWPGTRIALIGAQNLLDGAETISSIFSGRDIRAYPILDETRLEQTIRAAVADGAQTLVGGSSTCDLAHQYGLPCVLIESGWGSIDAAITSAASMLRAAQFERERAQTLNTILNSSFQGVLLTDHLGQVEMSNRYALERLGAGKGPLKGRLVTEFFPDLPYRTLLDQRQAVQAQLFSCGGQDYMLNCVSVGGEEGPRCVITFQSVEKILREEGAIRARAHRQGFVAKHTFQDIRRTSSALEQTIRIAKEFSTAEANILIRGETGTGKELFAQSIHNTSPRRNGPFVAINCAALPDNILESELFGHVEGAFTGAMKGGKAGFFEIAHRGTLFLDEIGDISPKLQGQLLRVLQEHEIIRVGGDTVIPVDVRVITATNKDLSSEVQQGAFREDLFYRLDVLELELSPLRQRKQDIPRLLEYFLDLEREKHACVLTDISPDGMKLLTAYPWPGNIREVINFCERLCILCKHSTAAPADIYMALPRLADHTSAPSPDVIRSDARARLEQALLLHHGNRQATARYLGIHPTTLWRQMKRFGLC